MPDVPLWNKCDNKCVMCTNMGGFSSQDSSHYGLKRQIEKLERWLAGFGQVYLKNSGKAGFLSLTGGEPALHPDFFRLLAYFRKRMQGADITLLSNGRRFAEKKFTEKFFKTVKPPFIIGVPVHGSSAAAHDGITGVRGSFNLTVRGIRNLLAGIGGGRRLGLEIRLVLHRLNIGDFGNMLSFLLGKFPNPALYRVTAIHYEIEGMALKNHRRLELKLSASAAVINSSSALIAQFADFRLYHFPLCLIKKELRAKCFITQPAEDRVYTKKCSGCRLRKKCPGLMAGYYEKIGDEELKPVK